MDSDQRQKKANIGRKSASWYSTLSNRWVSFIGVSLRGTVPAGQKWSTNGRVFFSLVYRQDRHDVLHPLGLRSGQSSSSIPRLVLHRTGQSRRSPWCDGRFPVLHVDTARPSLPLRVHSPTRYIVKRTFLNMIYIFKIPDENREVTRRSSSLVWIPTWKWKPPS